MYQIFRLMKYSYVKVSPDRNLVNNDLNLEDNITNMYVEYGNISCVGTICIHSTSVTVCVCYPIVYSNLKKM